MSGVGSRLFLAAGLLVSGSAAVADEPPGAEIRGQVVDENGAPVAAAIVEILPLAPGQVGAATGADGRFVLRSNGPAAGFRGVLQARARNLVGLANVGGAALGARPEPILITLRRPRRPVLVRVLDAAGKPVADATVVVTPPSATDPAQTGAGGIAHLKVLVGTAVSTVTAFKDGVGLDYYENFRSWPTTKFEDLPAELSLKLEGARTVTVRAADSEGRPVAGVRVNVFAAGRPGKLAGVSLWGSSAISATTDAEGFLRFAWLPRGGRAGLRVSLDSDELFVPDVLSVEPGGDSTVTIPVLRKGRISGRVVHPDGSPARLVRLVAGGRGKDMKGGSGEATTGDDGRYTMRVSPDRSYAVAVFDPEWAAEPRTGLVVREGQARDGVDFRLIPGTRLHGNVAGDPARRSGGKVVSIQLLGAEIPEDMRPSPRRKDRERVSLSARAGVDGRYETRLGPGEYEISGPTGPRETIRVDGTGEVVRDFAAIAPQVNLAGTVVDAVGAPVAGAALRVLAVGPPSGYPTQATSDAAGRFSLRRSALPALLDARSPDDSLAVLVPLAEGAAEVRVVLAPSATVTGRIVDGVRRPREGARMGLFLVAGPGGEPLRALVGGDVRTDRDGRYRFPAIATGARYEVHVAVRNGPGPGEDLTIKTFRVERPGPIELGEFVVPDAKSPAKP